MHKLKQTNSCTADNKCILLKKQIAARAAYES